MQLLVVLLLVAGVVCALVAASGVPMRPQLGWVAVACVAGALLVPAARALG